MGIYPRSHYSVEVRAIAGVRIGESGFTVHPRTVGYTTDLQRRAVMIDA
jgi:hypothetical protein